MLDSRGAIPDPRRPMPLIPPGAAKHSVDNSLPPGSVVMYEHEQQPFIGVVLEHRKAKVLVLNDRGRETELTPVRLHSLRKRVITGNSSRETLAALKEFSAEVARIQSEIDISTLWDVVHEAPKFYEESELLALNFPQASPEQYAALRLALIDDKIYFKRDKAGFQPRTPDHIAELKHAASVRDARRKLEDQAGNFFAERLKHRDIHPPSEVAPLIHLLMQLAARTHGIDVAKHREARELIQIFIEKTHSNLGGDLEAKALRLLQLIGEVTPETNLALVRYDPPREFSDAVLAESEAIAAAAARNTASGSGNRVIITIDDRSTRDMDDAISLEQTPAGYRLGVHISDVASAIQPGGAIEAEAISRGTSLYLPECTIPMLPPILSEDALSLIERTPRKVVSCYFDLTPRFDIERQSVALEEIVVTRRCSYEEADADLERGEPNISTLYEIAQHFEQKRLEAGAIRVLKNEVSVYPLPGGKVGITEIDELAPSRALISEFMVLANGAMAQAANSAQLPFIYRSQEGPEQLAETESPSSSGNEQSTRPSLKRSTMSTRPGPHASLALPVYAQVSSPIRRYLDLINQRQLVTWLQDGTQCYSRADLDRCIFESEETLLRATMLSRESRRFWLLRYLAQECANKRTWQVSVLRTDLRFPIVEFEQCYLQAPLKVGRAVRPGDLLTVVVHAVHPHDDTIRFEAVS